MKVDIERNAEIAMMRKNGATLKEIAEWYEVSQPRIVQICENFSDGDTKEEIIRNYKRKQEERKAKQEERKAKQEERKAKQEERKAREMERHLEWKRLEDQRKGGKEYVILNGAEELYLTAIEQADGQTVYRYKSADIHDALWFTLEDARRIARKRKARAIWVPAVRW